jgi:hypothetical protein
MQLATKDNKMNSKLQLLSQMYNNSNGKLGYDLLFKACFIKDLKDALSMLSYKQKVYFALQCSESVKYMIDDKKALIKAQKCPDLINAWLKNDKAASSEQELHNTANAAAYAITAANAAVSAFAAAYAADVAVWSANAAYHYHNKSDHAKAKQEQLNLSFLVQAASYKV